eukprot:114680-Prymnesium_polylepis.1
MRGPLDVRKFYTSNCASFCVRNSTGTCHCLGLSSEFLKTASYSSQNERSGHKLTAKSASDGAKAER